MYITGEKARHLIQGHLLSQKLVKVVTTQLLELSFVLVRLARKDNKKDALLRRANIKKIVYFSVSPSCTDIRCHKPEMEIQF